MMDRVDRELLAERAAAVVRHLDRVAEHQIERPYSRLCLARAGSVPK
jgi:hypothetical protein